MLRYSDLASVTDLVVPTASGFAAMKIVAWLDRHTPRDLFDLAMLARAEMIDHKAADAVKAIAGFRPTARIITNVPIEQVRADWDVELAHQQSRPLSPDESIKLLQGALEQL